MYIIISFKISWIIYKRQDTYNKVLNSFLKIFKILIRCFTSLLLLAALLLIIIRTCSLAMLYYLRVLSNIWAKLALLCLFWRCLKLRRTSIYFQLVLMKYLL